MENTPSLILEAKPLRIPSALSQQYLDDTFRMVARWEGYDEPFKKSIHDRLRRILRAWATANGIPNADKIVRTNLAGIAVSGETILHSDPVPGVLPNRGIYVVVQPDSSFGVLFRTVRNTSDYVGGPNNWMAFSEFFRTEGLNKLWATLQGLSHGN